MKFVFILCVFIVAILIDVQARTNNIVAANQNVQSRASDQGLLIPNGIVAAEQNILTRSNEQVRLIPDGNIAAEQVPQNPAGQKKLQSVVSN